MASVASELIEEVTAHAQSDRLEDAREICADGTYFPNSLRIYIYIYTCIVGMEMRSRNVTVCIFICLFEFHIFLFLCRT